jgi:hypothetical protein
VGGTRRGDPFPRGVHLARGAADHRLRRSDGCVGGDPGPDRIHRHVLSLRGLCRGAPDQLHDIHAVLGGIRPNAGQNGVVAIIGGQLAAFDLFDDSRTLERLWEPLVGAYAADALLHPCAYGARPGRRHVQEAIRRLGHAQATVHASPGAGEVVQLTGERGATASALVHGGVVVHLAAHWS